jgi:hypothetical protein
MYGHYDAGVMLMHATKLTFNDDQFENTKRLRCKIQKTMPLQPKQPQS